MKFLFLMAQNIQMIPKKKKSSDVLKSTGKDNEPGNTSSEPTKLTINGSRALFVPKGNFITGYSFAK